MTSRIEQLIDEIEAYIDGCKPQPLSQTKIIVNKEEIDECFKNDYYLRNVDTIYKRCEIK